MRKRLLVALGTAALAAGCGGDDGGDTGPVSVALLAPQTGALDFVGDSFARVAEVAVANINDNGGIDGRELQLTIADTRTDPATAKAELERLIAEGVIAVVGPATSGECAESYVTARDAQVPLISPSSTSPDLSDPDLIPPDDGYLFRNVPDDNTQGLAMAYYLRTARATPVGNVAVLYEGTNYGTGLKDAFKVQFESSGGVVGAEISFTQNLEHVCCPSTSECGGYGCVASSMPCGQEANAGVPRLCPGPAAVDAIDDLVQLNPDPEMVVLVALEQDAVELVLAWDDGGKPRIPGMTFFMTDGARSGGFLAAAPSSVVSMCGTAPTYPVTGQGYQTLQRAYELMYDDALAAQVFAPNVWDAFHLLGAALIAQSVDYRDEPLGGPHLRDAITEVSKEGQQRTAAVWQDIVLDLRGGNDIDYNGAAGPNDFNVVGQALGPYEVWCVSQGTAGLEFDQALFLSAQTLEQLAQ